MRERLERCGQPPADGGGDAGGGAGDDAGSAGASFQVEGTYPGNATTATGADLGGDHHTEIVTAGGDASGSQVGVWSFSGGSLQETGTYPVAGAAMSIATGDLAGSGKPEVVVGSQSGASAIVTVLANAGGSLGSSTSTNVAGADLVATGDLNEDGRADVVAASHATGTVTVLLGQADGTLVASSAWLLGVATLAVSPVALQVADIDGDGHLDVIAQDATSSALTVLTGDGAGAFVDTAKLGIDGSYVLDLYAAKVPLTGATAAVSGAAGPSGSGWTLAAGTFGADGSTGVAFTWNGGLYVVTRRPEGGFRVAENTGFAAAPIAAIGFGGGNQVDLAAMGTGSASATLSVLQASVYGPLAPVATTQVTGPFSGAVAGDFDGDGKADIALTTGTAITVLLGS